MLHIDLPVSSDEQDGVQAAVVLGVVCDFCCVVSVCLFSDLMRWERLTSVSSPHDLSSRGNQTQLAHIDLDDGALGQHAELGVQRVLGVLLDADDGQLNGDAELGVRDVGLLVAQAHGPDEALVLDGAAGEAGADEGRLRDHALPALLGRLLARLDDAEHLLLGNALDLGQGHAEAGGLFVALLLDGAGEGFCVFLVGPVEQVLRQGFCAGLGGLGRLDVAFFVGADRLLHLDLLLATLLRVQLRPQAAVVLRLLAAIVALTRELLALALVVVQTLAVPGGVSR